MLTNLTLGKNIFNFQIVNSLSLCAKPGGHHPTLCSGSAAGPVSSALVAPVNASLIPTIKVHRSGYREDGLTEEAREAASAARPSGLRSYPMIKFKNHM